ncbi:MULTISPECIES: ABC transporter ATP-binding protein [Bacillus]|uniref:ABC transporter ATP-binding protein n=1 Tax=Bacillus glycinifermentans TaxID=1664069 RepID=A0AAJ4D1G5_9BACI|nr:MULTISPECIES: ABC transporter ATP-binding protein [Bacillus]KKB71613.1 bacitracin ABC transporter ATP-binding protein [Bacillus sp. TH008]MBU8788481.1 ABC transporter ATP-binding protein [Bacillus glycinifermentans]MDU0071810.1 ABC transporter ATP-binding protein [Bacillus sp. IG6]MED8019971.1 ABC transporter ATP-binding protein [Bacillus glycinifermentans]NUJ17955.1 ABC transporter ATP-binding protein [Bacillus glycinifermentans]
METLLQLKNVSKTIRGKKIIDGLSFDVRAGEVFGFLGPNGAGKTTTIRMIVGHMGISSGDIIVCGVNVKENFEKAARHIGAIVENPELYKFLTGYQNLQQYARMSKGVTKSKIDEVIELVGLKSRIHDKVKTYSLGMRQRLGLAQSLLHDPKLLILDEPTNGLDPAGIREIRDYLRRLTKEKGLAVIVSSHLLSEMEIMCDRIAIIQNGTLRDIQHVHEPAADEKKRYFLQADDRDALLRHASAFGERSIEQVKDGIELSLLKEEVPELIKHLTDNGVRLYEAKAVTKSLEDRFLEITEEREGTKLA